MKRNKQATRKPGRYSYHRDFTGSAARIRILDPQGDSVLNIYFWDDPNTTEAAAAQKKAKLLVAAMNLRRGGSVELPQIFSLLAERRQIATYWGVDDVQQLRPDLSGDQAWEILQQVDLAHDRDHGLTRNTIRHVADELFPESSQRKPKRSRAKKPCKRSILPLIPF